MAEKLTFGELCEAVMAKKSIQMIDDGEWCKSNLHEELTLAHAHFCYSNLNYRIKPEPVKRFNWVCKSPNEYWILGNHKQKYTREEAEFILKEKYSCSEIIEPYLPIEASE